MVGRAPAFWTEANTRLIREYFVAVSVSNLDQARQDAIGQFLRDAGIELPGAGGSQYCVTADGKVLMANTRSALNFSVKKALAAWNALPAAARAPGAVQVGAMDAPDAKKAPPVPPEGGIILKVYSRAFMRDSRGNLRYVTGRDLFDAGKRESYEAAIERQYPGYSAVSQAQPDHLWLTQAEWKSLLPTAPRLGDSIPMPRAIADRFLRWHLNPLQLYGETSPLPADAVRAGELKLTTEAVSETSVRLRLDGFARLGKEPPAEVAAGKAACFDRWGYEPRVLGYVEYDPRQGVITRFDIVALGDHFGRLGIAASPSRIGLQPIGISFELVRGDTPAERVPPGRAVMTRSYFTGR